MTNMPVRLCRKWCWLCADGSLACIHKGPTLEVVNVGSGVRVASLSADLLTEDVFATVVCVREFSCSDRLQLLVAINCSNDVGIVALLDTAISMVVKAIEIPCKVGVMRLAFRFARCFFPFYYVRLDMFWNVMCDGCISVFMFPVGHRFPHLLSICQFSASTCNVSCWCISLRLCLKIICNMLCHVFFCMLRSWINWKITPRL